MDPEVTVAARVTEGKRKGSVVETGRLKVVLVSQESQSVVYSF